MRAQAREIQYDQRLGRLSFSKPDDVIKPDGMMVCMSSFYGSYLTSAAHCDFILPNPILFNTT